MSTTEIDFDRATQCIREANKLIIRGNQDEKEYCKFSRFQITFKYVIVCGGSKKNKKTVTFEVHAIGVVGQVPSATSNTFTQHVGCHYTVVPKKKLLKKNKAMYLTKKSKKYIFSRYRRY